MGNEPSLKDRAQEELKNNPSALGDPTSLKAENSDNVPTKEEQGADKVPKKDAGEENSSMLGDHTSLEKERIEPGSKTRNSKL